MLVIFASSYAAVRIGNSGGILTFVGACSSSFCSCITTLSGWDNTSKSCTAGKLRTAFTVTKPGLSGYFLLNVHYHTETKTLAVKLDFIPLPDHQ